jgi:acyl-coenzyme A thioesterase PaaI-like protein
LKFEQTEPNKVIADCILSEEYQGYPGVVHGGIVAAILDEIAGRSHMGDNNPPRFMYTAKLEIRYRKTVPTGQPLHLVGKAGSGRGRMATATGAIFNQNGDLLAEADAILLDVPADIIDGVDLEALGWKVYPDE